MSRFFEALERARQERVAQVERDGKPALEVRSNGALDTGTTGTDADLSVAALLEVGGQQSSEDDPSAVGSESSVFDKPSTPNAYLERLRSAALPVGSLDKHLVSLLSPRAYEADQYRTLRHVVEQKRRDKDMRVLAITSPAVGDGKTVTTINLAGALGQSVDARVLLVDLDLRSPSMTHQLGVYGPDEVGIVDAVLDPHLSLQDIVVSYPSYNLSIVPSGTPPSPPYEVLKSPRLREILYQARERFDYVLLDTPPIVPFSDCRLLGNGVDAFLVVIAAQKTPKDMLDEALKLLEPEKVLGIVYNSDDCMLKPRYKFYYNYHRQTGREKGWSLFRRKTSSA